MCGRYASSQPPEFIARVFRTTNALPNVAPSWNIAPSQDAMAVRRQPETAERHLDLLKWGLVPHWSKDPPKTKHPINARAETVATSAMFRGAFAQRRCLVPADAFYEWKANQGGKQPFAIARHDGGRWRSLACGKVSVLWRKRQKGSNGAMMLREAMAAEKKGERIGGEGRTVEVDGAYFGGYVKPANLKENRRDRRLAENKSGKREVAVVVRERDGSTLPAVFKSESAALGWISSRVAKGTALVADEASSWNDLHNRYEISRIDHQQAYSLNGVYSNNAESFFSRLRRGEIGHRHHVAGPYLVRYAQESAWREDNRRVSNGEQAQQTVSLALASRPSVDFCGYWQRHKAV